MAHMRQGAVKCFISQILETEMKEAGQSVKYFLGNSNIDMDGIMVWVQGVVCEIYAEDQSVCIDDGTGTVKVSLIGSSNYRRGLNVREQWGLQKGDYVMAVGGILHVEIWQITAQICVQVEDPNLETLWMLEVMKRHMLTDDA